jgi:O-antigen ligase
MSITISTMPITSRLIVFFLGVSLPSVVFGRAVFAIFIGLAIITLFYCKPWREIIRDLVNQVKTPLGSMILINFVAWIPNVFISDFPIRSFEAIFRTLIFISIAAMFYSYLRSNTLVLYRVLQVFTFATAVTMGFALLSMTVLPEIYWLFKLQGWLSQPIGSSLKGFSALAVLIVPLLIVATRDASKIWKLACGMIILSVFLLVLQTDNRSAIAGFITIALAMVIVSLLNKASKTKAISLLMGACASVMGVVVWLKVTRMHLQGIVPNEDWLIPVWLLDFERQVIWRQALEFGMVSPWIGIGANTINFVHGADRVINGTPNLHVIPAHPHNWAVEIFAETGAIGLIFLLVTIAVFAVQTLLKVRRTSRFELIAAIAIMAGYWGSGLFNFSYWSAWWQLSFLISLAICFACAYGPEKRLSYKN